jgi:uncharacterized protein DUF3135
MNQTNHKSEPESDFDFDYWMQLAKNDPAEFEKQRRAITLAMIEKSPDCMHNRLYGLQWCIDGQIKQAKNPLDACLKIHRMMMDSVFGDDGLVDALKMQSRRSKPDSGDKVIDFSAYTASRK